MWAVAVAAEVLLTHACVHAVSLQLSAVVMSHPEFSDVDDLEGTNTAAVLCARLVGQMFDSVAMGWMDVVCCRYGLRRGSRLGGLVFSPYSTRVFDWCR